MKGTDGKEAGVKRQAEEKEERRRRRRGGDCEPLYY